MMIFTKQWFPTLSNSLSLPKGITIEKKGKERSKRMIINDYYYRWVLKKEELEIGSRIGVGSFGEVRDGTWKGTKVAIKLLVRQVKIIINIY